MGMTTANEQQLRQALAQQVKHSEVQDRVIRDLSQRLGAAGAVLKEIGKAAKGRRTDESARREIIKILHKFEAAPGRGAGQGKKRGGDV